MQNTQPAARKKVREAATPVDDNSGRFSANGALMCQVGSTNQYFVGTGYIKLVADQAVIDSESHKEHWVIYAFCFIVWLVFVAMVVMLTGVPASIAGWVQVGLLTIAGAGCFSAGRYFGYPLREAAARVHTLVDQLESAQTEASDKPL